MLFCYVFMLDCRQFEGNDVTMGANKIYDVRILSSQYTVAQATFCRIMKYYCIFNLGLSTNRNGASVKHNRKRPQIRQHQ